MSTTATVESVDQKVQGLLEMHPDGYGFLRTVSLHCGPTPNDAYVPAEMIRRFDLREGVLLEGTVQPSPQNNGVAHDRAPPRDHRRNGRNNQRRPMPSNQRKAQGPRLANLISIEGVPAEENKRLRNFDTLTPVDPRGWLKLETAPDRMTTRVVDMFTPIGKGQRGLIVSPPRSGKTILIQHIADSISDNHPDVELFVLLVDERPEEVTEMRRTVRGKVWASSNDRETASHVRLAQLIIERAKRLVERGRDVVVLLDSITRLARAYNKHIGNTGRTMSGGLDVKALDIPKRLFGSARAFDEGGSLTVMATALIETGSRMDDVIFQEFKGTGNMELILDRKLSERRLFPAIDICGSGTRKEELLLPAEDLERITILRRSLIKLSDVDAMESMLKQLKKYPTNKEFLAAISKIVA